MTKREAEILPYKMEAIGILNRYGQLWTHNTFDNAEAAKTYVARFWRDVKAKDIDLDGYSYVPVMVTVEPLPGASPS